MISTISNAAVAILAILLALAALLLMFYRFWFLRKPKRQVPKGNVIVSPANGKIVKIIEIGKKGSEINAGGMTLEKGLLGKVNLLVKDTLKKGYIIVIMMTPLHVHYQRSPVDGTVERTKHRKGKFLDAVKDASSLNALQNEKNEITIRNQKIGRLKVVHVAGFLARRIHCFVRPKQNIHKGEELGLISLGSQVILVMPKLKLAVREGQKVIDGETVIARLGR